MSERRTKGCLVAAVIWCVILAVLAVGYKFLVHPYLTAKLKDDTGSASPYAHEIVIAADSFSGYAILRSEKMKDDLRARQIRLSVQDDNADYAARLDALAKGAVQMAVFTVDSFITAGARSGDFPGTIVLVIDETKGGDAIVAHSAAIPNLQALNHRDARFVLTPDSPSEFLARVVIAHFSLPQLPEDWFAKAEGARDAYQQLVRSGPAEKRAFVLWEPYVSKALEQPGVQTLLDTSKLQGYIVDVLVAQRAFLRDHPDLVRAVIEAYARANYAYASQPDGLSKLVQEDARQTGAERLDAKQAQQIVQGVHWKNTLENYAHFGLGSAAPPASLPLLEDIIANIIDVLVKTKALAQDPLANQYHTLYYDRILAEMRAGNFHPGQELNLIPGLNPASNQTETLRAQQTLSGLTPAQWDSLRPVGELNVAPIVFSRGSARITVGSQRDLETLAKRLQSFPRFYLRVLGHTRAEGDPDANRALAQSRAQAAVQFLQDQGIPAARLKAEAAPSSAAGSEAQAVSFVVGQLAY